MERKILVVGDMPSPGGRVLPYEAPYASTINGHQVALIGGRAYCEGCNSVGLIAKAGGPRRVQYISEVALEGDVVVCYCPTPQPLIATLQHTATCDDGAWYAVGAEPSLAVLAVLVAAEPSQDVAALKKVVDDSVTHPPEAEPTENICPNMTNKEFCALVLRLRDQAVALISKKRLPELDRWDTDAKARVKEWFGVADPSTREHLRQGLTACERVLEGLGCKNFIRYSEASKKNLGCTFPSNAVGTIAAVCKPDVATHTIAIGLDFCGFPDNRLIYGTGKVRDGDSQLLTLIHEVTHFDDTFGSFDTWYGTTYARAYADNPGARVNADSIAAYIVGVDSKASV